MDYNQLLSEVESYVHAHFISHSNPSYFYHDVQHTERVVRATMQIANHYQLNDTDFFLVVAAAWFHDLGYFTAADHHELEGIKLATEFLKDKQTNDAVIQQIAGCIRATRLPQSPQNLYEQIVCDADLFHLGSEDFFLYNRLLRKEMAAIRSTEIDKKKWWEQTLLLLENHQYYTDYCRLLLNDTLQKNIQKLKGKIEKLTSAGVPPEAKKKDSRKDKENRPDKGIETMFRVTSNNNQRLSNMADNKAHIMITVNSIILSAVISFLLKELDAQPNLAIPTYIILAVCVLVIIFSILATLPKLPSGKFTEEDLEKKDVNLLFFGNFYKMSLKTYTAGMWRVMNDREFLYGSLIRDVYSQGVVLGRKYKLLRISYNIFMYGLIISIIGYITVMIATL